MHGHAGIAQHGLGAGGGHDHIAMLARIADVPQVALLLLVFHLGVRQRGFAQRAPVDDARAAVDQALFVQAHEHFVYRAVESLVHGEALARPVAGSAQLALLAHDAAAVLLAPLPGAAQEFFAAQVFFRQALFFQRVDDFDFRGDGSVIRARQP